MNRTTTPKRVKGIRMVGAAVGLTMAPVLALAQTVAAAASQGAVYSPVAPAAPYYYGQGMMAGWGPGYYGPGMMGGFGLFWGFLCLLAIVGIVGGIVFLMRGGACRHGYKCVNGVSGNGNAALKLLEERYARGEIGRDEYLEKRSELEK